MGWGFDYLCWPWGKAFDQYNLVLPGEGIFESLFARRGPDVGPTWARRGEGFDCRLGRKRLRPNISFPTSTLNARDVRSGMKDLEIMEANENYPKVSGFYCINQLNLLRYCGIKVNGSKEKPSRCLQVQLISVWLTFATITV